MAVILLLLLGALLLNVYALALVLLRAPVFGARRYRPMVVNIGLSIAPAAVLALVVVAMLVVAVVIPNTVVIWAVVVIGAGVWLLALPNSAYLITELNLSHRREGEAVPLWYDIVLVLTLALSGVINTLLNLLLAKTIYVLIAHPNDAHPLRHADAWILACAVLLLVTFGIYLGRYIRFNSWDVAHPGAFWRKLRDHFGRPGARREAVAFCVTHAILLMIVYLLVMAPALSILWTPAAR